MTYKTLFRNEARKKREEKEKKTTIGFFEIFTRMSEKQRQLLRSKLFKTKNTT